MPALIRRPGGRGGPAPGIRKPTYNRGWTHVICVASGPSLTIEQAQRITIARPGWRVIAVNNTWERVPEADVLLALDRSWWEMHLPSVLKRYRGECWTSNRWIAHRAGLHLVEASDEPGLSAVNGRIHTGGNGGYSAMGLAYLFGARTILLAGFDFQDSYGQAHWHGNHPLPLNQDRPFAGWLQRLPPLIRGLEEQGVRIVNCSIETAIDCIPRGDLTSCLSQYGPPQLADAAA